MKCILLLTFVALCSSYPYGTTGGRNVNIHEDGTIVITETNGKKVTITKGVGYSGQKNIDISISGPNFPTKKIHINEQNELKDADVLEHRNTPEGQYDVSHEYQRDKRSSKGYKSRSQGDILTEILKQYQGTVDDASYQQLLQQVNYAVQSGHLNQAIYDVLQTLGQAQVVSGQGQGSRCGAGRQGIAGCQSNVFDLLHGQQQLAGLLQQQQQQGTTLGQAQVVPGQGQGLRCGAGRQGIAGCQSNVFDLLHGQQQLAGLLQQHQQGSSYGVPVSVFGQQISSPYGQSIASPIGTEGAVYTYVVPGSHIGADSGYGSQYLHQRGNTYPSQYGQQAVPSQIIGNERGYLNQQPQIQQLQQQQTQQILLRQLQQQQQQQQQQQVLQQLQQQQQEQQLQLQQQVLQQYQQGMPWWQYLLNSRPINSGVQQSGVPQQLGVHFTGLLTGGYGNQVIPWTQHYNVPLVY